MLCVEKTRLDKTLLPLFFFGIVSVGIPPFVYKLLVAVGEGLGVTLPLPSTSCSALRKLERLILPECRLGGGGGGAQVLLFNG